MTEKKEFEFSNLIWLHCDLQLRKKVIVRHGQRKEVPTGDKWVFCPLQHFPHDRVSIKTCKKCKHFKGYSKITVNQRQTTSQYVGKEFKWKTIEKKSENKKKIIITDKDINKIIEKQKEWEKAERSDKNE